MAEPLFNVTWDSASLGAIANLNNFSSFLDPEMVVALTEIGDLIVQAAISNTWSVFSSPSGQLASAITSSLTGPLEVIVEVGVPYAWRMEEGFFGTDSLGRTYNQEPKPYILPAIQDNEDQIMVLMNLAAANAIAKIAPGGI